MYGREFGANLAWLIEVLACYDEHEYFVCGQGDRIVRRAPELEACPVCGDTEIEIQISRKLALEIILPSLRSSVFPYRLIEWSERPRNETTWYWRGRKLFSYMRDNPFSRA